MLDHVGVQVADVAASTAFYAALVEPLGCGVLMKIDGADVVGFGRDGVPTFWLSPAGGEERRELHIAFAAPDRAAVDGFRAAAGTVGAEILHEPREFPEYHPGYYGCFVRDLDGHNVEAVCHRPG